jgi:hypothetical protein
MFKKVVFTITIIIFILSIVNAVDESENPAYIFLVSLLAILSPLLSACIVFLVKGKTHRPKVLEICTYIVGAVGLVCYAGYAANGTTNPDTAAHMHLILFPVAYGVFSFFVMTIGIGISFIGSKSPVTPLRGK